MGAVVDGLLPGNGRVSPVLLDLVGYDASAGLYTLTKIAGGWT